MKLTTLASAALLAGLSPVLAWAQCPTKADLDTGIFFRIEGGDVDYFKSAGADEVMEIYATSGGSTLSPEPVNRLLLARGLYVVTLVDLGARGEAETTSFSYSVPVAELPQPAADTRFEVTSTSGVAGEPPKIVRETYVFGPEEEVAFGDCRYRAIPIAVTYEPGDGETERYAYLPELRLSYMIGWDSQTFTYQSIHVAVAGMWGDLE